MITGALMARKNTGRTKYSGYEKAREIVRLVNELNQKVVSGKKQFDARICDFVTTPIAVIKQDIDNNGDNVYLIAHGGLVVNDKLFSPIRYKWNSHDKVVEQIYPDGNRNHGVSIGSFGPRLNMNNVYGCFLSPHVRKVKSGRWFPNYTSSIDDYANMYEGLLARLSRYRNMKSNCIIKIRIYEGENANESSRDYAETDNVLEKWPVVEEEYYK